MITKDNTSRVMELFFKNPDKKYHLRELERLTKLSMPGVRKIGIKLEKEGLLLSKKEKMVKNFYASRNEKFMALKRAYNLYSLFSSGFIGFLKQTYEEPEAIVLFGSYSRGEDTSISDIDIAVITPMQKNIDTSIFEKKLGRPLKIYEIKLSKAEKDFINTLANGIVLYGYLKVI